MVFPQLQQGLKSSLISLSFGSDFGVYITGAGLRYFPTIFSLFHVPAVNMEIVNTSIFVAFGNPMSVNLTTTLFTDNFHIFSFQ
jgi:hypothetical protein